MVELGEISQDEALALVRRQGGILTDLKGAYWDLEDVIALIGTSDRILEVTGVGHELWILRGDIEFKVNLLS